MPALNELDEYLNALEVAEPTRIRINRLLEIHGRLYGRPPKTILVENEVSPDGNSILISNLAAITDNVFIDLPIPEPNWHSSATRLGIISQVRFALVHEYDFTQATPASRLSVEMAGGAMGTLPVAASYLLRAAGRNCDFVFRYAHDSIVPTLFPQHVAAGAP